jgi:transcriptional regulator GlxA family with amidase domain
MVAFDRFEMLDVVGPLEAFASARPAAGAGYVVEVVTLAGGPVRAASGLTLDSAVFDPAATDVDTLLVAGGAGVFAAAEDGDLVARLRQAAAAARRVGSVCTGAFLLAAAGLLAGRHAATHWKWCDRLAETHPDVTVERDRIHVCDGGIWSSAGVTAGIDLALAMIEADHGAETALAVARELVVHLKRPGGQAQFGVELKAQATRDAAIRRALDQVLAHPEAVVTVEDLAGHAAMSLRNFSRVFRAETGQTPAGFVEEVRIARACRLLEATRLPVEEVAARSGFRSADVLRRALLRRRAVTPLDYRARFETARDAPPG